MKKIIAILLALLLIIGTAGVALAKPHYFTQQAAATQTATQTTTQTTTTTLPAKSTYEFTYQLPSGIVAQKDTPVDVSFKTAVLGQQGYEGVHFEFAATNTVSGTVYFSAKDSANNLYTFTDAGTWGPQSGFALPATYNATTNWTLKFSKAGEYNISFKAVDSANNKIAESSQIVTVTEAAFVYTVTENVYASQETTLNVGLITQQSYNNVHIEFGKTAGTGNITFKTKDAANTLYTFNNAGTWNIGGSIAGPYNVTTPWLITADQPGSYTITFKLVDNNNQILAQASQTLTVKDPTSIQNGADEDEDEDEDKDGSSTQGLLNALRNHYKGNKKVNHGAEILIEKLLERGVTQSEIDAITGTVQAQTSAQINDDADDNKQTPGEKHKAKGKKH